MSKNNQIPMQIGIVDFDEKIVELIKYVQTKKLVNKFHNEICFLFNKQITGT